MNKTNVKIGKKIMSLPSSFCRWPANPASMRLYGLAFAQIPTTSARYLSLALPIFIAAFFHDIGLSQYFEGDERLEFIANITPCNKKIDECILLLHEFLCYKIGSYVNKGAIMSCTHDKGERKKLGRLIRLVSLFNLSQKFDTNFHDSIISF